MSVAKPNCSIFVSNEGKGQISIFLGRLRMLIPLAYIVEGKLGLFLRVVSVRIVVRIGGVFIIVFTLS